MSVVQLTCNRTSELASGFVVTLKVAGTGSCRHLIPNSAQHNVGRFMRASRWFSCSQSVSQHCYRFVQSLEHTLHG